jgi:uncharacterized protein YqhQ
MANKKSKKKSEWNEKKEAWMRIPILIVSGIILFVWRYFIVVLMIVNFFYTIFKNKRLKELAEMSEIWNTQWYVFQRYMIFLTNERPFPFTSLNKNRSNFK